ncbi:Agmatinase [Manis pentadactyla]|nr:Agmatinase [Manis pentadactyla]
MGSPERKQTLTNECDKHCENDIYCPGARESSMTGDTMSHTFVFSSGIRQDGLNVVGCDSTCPGYDLMLMPLRSGGAVPDMSEESGEQLRDSPRRHQGTVPTVLLSADEIYFSSPQQTTV